ncbi:MAG TPA: hypothetical protein VM557_13930 [Thermoanaerobaculia bacterium]|nr:hypothetical protein [Thermoanaerobaculia bacterium]
MASQPAQPPPVYDWAKLVGHSLKQNGAWATYEKLLEARRAYPEDLLLRGYAEIVRNTIVRDLLGSPKGLQSAPKLTPEFLTDFDRFNLTAQEGYLISLIDGRISLDMLLKLTPFDNFTTLFTIAKLQNQRAISMPS